MPIYVAVQCADCDQYQAIQKPKNRKWKCRTCSKKQSLVRVYAQSDKGKDIRPIVQGLNMSRACGINEAARPESAQESAVAVELAGVAPSASVEDAPNSKWGQFMDQSDMEMEVKIGEVLLATSDQAHSNPAAMQLGQARSGKRKRQKAQYPSSQREVASSPPQRNTKRSRVATEGKRGLNEYHGASSQRRASEADAPIVTASGARQDRGPHLPSLSSLGVKYSSSSTTQTGRGIGASTLLPSANGTATSTLSAAARGERAPSPSSIMIPPGQAYGQPPPAQAAGSLEDQRFLRIRSGLSTAQIQGRRVAAAATSGVNPSTPTGGAVIQLPGGKATGRLLGQRSALSGLKDASAGQSSSSYLDGSETAGGRVGPSLSPAASASEAVFVTDIDMLGDDSLDTSGRGALERDGAAQATGKAPTASGRRADGVPQPSKPSAWDDFL